jgi:hypothetical protein
VDFIDLFFTGQLEDLDTVLSGLEDAGPIGVRLEPDGEGLRLAVSGLSADSFVDVPLAMRPWLPQSSVWTPGLTAFSLGNASGIEVVGKERLVPPEGSSDLVSEMRLVETTDNSMEWTIRLRNDGHHLYQLGGGHIPPYVVIQINLRRGFDDVSEGRVVPGAYTTGVYQSPGYACGPDPAAGCGGQATMDVEDAEVQFGWQFHPAGVDCIAFDIGGVVDGSPTPPGWGVRISRLEQAPDMPGAAEPIAGKAWLEVVLPYPVSASFGEGTELLRIPAPNLDGLLTEMVLVEANDGMTRWVVGLHKAGAYEYAPLVDAGPAFWIHIRQATFTLSSGAHD